MGNRYVHSQDMWLICSGLTLDLDPNVRIPKRRAPRRNYLEEQEAGDHRGPQLGGHPAEASLGRSVPFLGHPTGILSESSMERLREQPTWRNVSGVFRLEVACDYDRHEACSNSK